MSGDFARDPEADRLLDRLALAMHEADFGQECRASGTARRQHIDAYYPSAARFLARRRRGYFSNLSEQGVSKPAGPPPVPSDTNGDSRVLTAERVERTDDPGLLWGLAFIAAAFVLLSVVVWAFVRAS